jgi:fermentation-respiration switch protein FrsA (DUF1100 family)
MLQLRRGVQAAGRRIRWRRLALIAVACYIGVILMLMALENAFVYHPIRATAEWQTAPDPSVQDAYLRSADGTRIHALWWPRPGSNEALLYCHGNAGNLSHRGESMRRWHDQLNVNVLIFDYPGYGKSEGKPSEAGCYAAADAAYQWLIQSARIQPQDIIIEGGSLGAAVAIELARRVPHRALIAISAFTSIPDMARCQFPWLPARWLVRNRFDNLSKIADCAGPVFIAHGDCDNLVPFSQGQRLFAAAREPKRFYRMVGWDHNDAADESFFVAFRTFLSEAGGTPGRR